MMAAERVTVDEAVEAVERGAVARAAAAVKAARVRR